MKKIFLIILIFLLAVPLVAQHPQSVRQLVSWTRHCTASDFQGMNLPKIAGTWYWVDAADGSDLTTMSGKSHDEAFASLDTAYAHCTSGAGDGIIIVSRSVSGTSNSVLLTSRLTWAKYGITVIGLAAPVGYFGRARITTSSTADSLAALMYVTGQNNVFINLDFVYAADCQSNTALRTAQRSAVQIGGARNAWINCHFNAYEVNTAGASTNTYAAYQSTGIEIRASGDENVFDGCYFGSSSYDVGNTTSCWIYLMGATAQDRFRDCTFFQQVSSGTAFGAFETSGATVLNGIDIFQDCVFGVWRANTHADICASWFIGTKPNTGNIILKDCVTGGFTALDAVGGNDVVWTNQPASNAAGGITVAP